MSVWPEGGSGSMVNAVPTSTFRRLQGGSPMETYRQRIAASLALLAVVVAFFVGGLLMRPRTAGAASSKGHRFVFGPTFARNPQQLFVQFVNTTQHTTPACSVGVFKQDGGLVAAGTVDPVLPGGIGSFEYDESTQTDLYVIANFAPPTSGQAIPN